MPYAPIEGEAELTVWREDGSVLTDCSTNATHARPYLFLPDEWAESEVDLARGTAVIGQTNIRVLDKRTVPTDQRTGWFTALLGAAGESALNGRRARLRRYVDGAWIVQQDGVIGGVELNDEKTSYTLPLRDENERARKTRAFQITDTPTVFPRGVLNGYGKLPNGTWLIPPTTPARGTFTRSSSTAGAVAFTAQQYLRAEHILTEDIRQAIEPEWDEARQARVLKHATVMWRPAAGGAWTELVEMSLPDFAALNLTYEAGLFQIQRGVKIQAGALNLTVAETQVTVITGIRMTATGTGTSPAVPANGASIDVIVRYRGPPTETYPLHVDETTFGAFLAALYDGDYSPTGTIPIRYDSTAVSALTTPLRARVTEPVDNLREWVEKHIYQPLGAAPAINADGAVSPVRYALPGSGTTITVLTDANTTPASTWSHPAEGVVNVVHLKYTREFRMLPEDDPFGVLSSGDGILSLDVHVEHSDETSVAIHGEQRLDIEPVTLTSIGGVKGRPWGGDTVHETGHLLAEQRARQALDRFVNGAQTMRIRATRTATAALRPGDWVQVQVGHFPDYATGIRGSDRLAQVVSIQDVNPAYRELVAIDAGAANNPLAVPTVGAPTADAAGVVSVAVTAIPSGAEAVVEFAVSALAPAADSGLWTFMGRTATPTTLRGPVLGAGQVVWVRARSEATGRRPSAYTTPQSVTLPATPRFLALSLVLDTSGVATVLWTPNDYAAGVRIYYKVHATGADPGVLTTFVDRAGSALNTTLALTFGADQSLTILAEPWSGWTGSAVSGTTGQGVQLTREAEPTPVTEPVLAVDAGGEGDFTTIQAAIAHAVAQGAYYTSPWVINVRGGQTFTENVTVPGGIILNAEAVTLYGTLTVDSGCTVNGLIVVRSNVTRSACFIQTLSDFSSHLINCQFFVNVDPPGANNLPVFVFECSGGGGSGITRFLNCWAYARNGYAGGSPTRLGIFHLLSETSTYVEWYGGHVKTSTVVTGTSPVKLIWNESADSRAGVNIECPFGAIYAPSVDLCEGPNLGMVNVAVSASQNDVDVLYGNTSAHARWKLYSQRFNNLDVHGDLDIGENLTVSGDSTLSGDLDVLGTLRTAGLDVSGVPIFTEAAAAAAAAQVIATYTWADAPRPPANPESVILITNYQGTAGNKRLAAWSGTEWVALQEAAQMLGQVGGAQIAGSAVGDAQLNPGSAFARQVQSKAQAPISGGGDMTWTTGFLFSWTVQLRSLPNALASNGWFGFGPFSNISIPANNALYFRVLIGGDQTHANTAMGAGTVGYFVTAFNTYAPPSPTSGYTDLLIAVHSGDNGALYLFDGRVIPPGKTIRGGLFIPDLSVTNAMITELHGNKITANTITATQADLDSLRVGILSAAAAVFGALAAGSIGVKHLAVGFGGAALNSDPNTSDASAWANYPTSVGGGTVVTITNGKVGTTALRNTANTQWLAQDIKRIPVDPTKQYRIHDWARSVGGNGVHHLQVHFWNASGTNVGVYGVGGVNPGSNWTEYTGTFGAGSSYAIPAGAVTMSLVIGINYEGTVGYGEVQDARIEEVLPGVLIRDGAITAPKISVSDLAAINALFTGTLKVQLAGTGEVQFTNAGTEFARLDSVDVSGTANVAFLFPTGTGSSDMILAAYRQDATVRGVTINGRLIVSPAPGLGATGAAGFSVDGGHDCTFGNNAFRNYAALANSQTRLEVELKNAAGVVETRRVVVGAADSGGPGFRMLRIAN